MLADLEKLFCLEGRRSEGSGAAERRILAHMYRSAGKKQEFDGNTYTVEELTADRCVRTNRNCACSFLCDQMGNSAAFALGRREACRVLIRPES